MRNLLGEDSGIIPADAGSTSGRHTDMPHMMDHPRGCGEHHTETLSAYLQAGSSPRMRGARFPLDKVKDGERIIPADAGSTCPGPDRAWGSRDHPRGCGEHTLADGQYGGCQGSSPRMRGAQNVNRHVP